MDQEQNETCIIEMQNTAELSGSALMYGWGREDDQDTRYCVAICIVNKM